MSTARRFAPTGHNLILDGLPAAERARLERHLEPVRLELKDVLYDVNEPIAHVHFPVSGVVSLVSVMEDGTIAEVATVGNEGMVGLPVFLGAGSIPGRALCQVPGEALCIPAEGFRAEANAGGPLQRALQRYTQGLFNQIAQSAACNRLHPMEERCARWILMTHDRVGADEFPLTHEFLSQMLGVRRATVTVATGMLQKAGLIRSQRGLVTVLDRPGLEAASCECYRVIREEYDRLLG